MKSIAVVSVCRTHSPHPRASRLAQESFLHAAGADGGPEAQYNGVWAVTFWRRLSPNAIATKGLKRCGFPPPFQASFLAAS